MAKKKLLTKEILKNFMTDRISITINPKNAFIKLQKRQSFLISSFFKKTDKVIINFNNVNYIITILNINSDLVLSISFSINPIIILKSYLIKNKIYDVTKEKEFLLKNNMSNNFIHPECISEKYKFNKLIIFKKALEVLENNIIFAKKILTTIINILKKNLKININSDFDVKMTVLELCLDIEYSNLNISKEIDKILSGFAEMGYMIERNNFFIIARKYKNVYYKIYFKALNLIRFEVVKLRDALGCNMIYNNAQDFYQKIKLHSEAYEKSLHEFYIAQEI